MAIVRFPGGLIVPPPMGFNSTTPAFSSQVIDASDERVAFTFTVPKTGTLERVEFRTASPITIDAASKLKISFQDFDASRNPDGVADQYRLIDGSDIAANTWIVPGAMTDDGTDTGNKRSVTRGQRLACVIEYDTFTAADSVLVAVVGGTAAATWTSPNFLMSYVGSSWSKSEGPLACMALRYDDGTYTQIIGVYPIKSLNTATYNSGSTPDERGMLFQLPAPMLVGGVVIRLSVSTSSLSVPVVLYDVDGQTVLRTSTLTGFGSTTGKHYNLRFDSDVRLEANVPYRLTVKPSSATNLSLYDFEVNSSELMEMMEGGTTWQYCERTNDGDWTDTENKRPWMSLWVTGIDHDISGGSGGSGDGGIE